MSSNLPPGVTQSMIDRQYEGAPCDICGFLPEDCICLECPECQGQGDRICYRDHGLKLTAEQVIGHQRMMLYRAQELVTEERMYLEQLESAYGGQAGEEGSPFHPEDFVHILDLDKLPQKEQN